MASHEVNPMVLPPDLLAGTKINKRNDTESRLELPYDPDQDIWSYYSIMRVSPIIMDDFLAGYINITLGR